MNILIIDNGSIFIEKLVDCFDGHDVKIVKYRRHTRVDREWADLYVLSGGSRPAIFQKWYAKELELIITAVKPIIGICIGFELIASAHGAKLIRLRRKVLGLFEITINPNYFGFENRTQFLVYQAHRWVLRSSGSLEILGWSERGAEIIKHRTKPIIGMQFHPEKVTPENDGNALLTAALQALQLEVEGVPELVRTEKE